MTAVVTHLIRILLHNEYIYKVNTMLTNNLQNAKFVATVATLNYSYTQGH